ncbi:hypothetical protein SAMN05421756_103221 [Microlunatus flavus]|uniref:Uncharacterized protein n=1 Tax=Microlunatus flavus TaxID=1036181 RepID=A0A1H9FD34_9ACTN|nr:hypothetical protein SAMN05421756_103221 [Microlunatus flavus]
MPPEERTLWTAPAPRRSCGQPRQLDEPLTPDNGIARNVVVPQRFADIGGWGEAGAAQAGRCQRGLGALVFHSTIDHWLRWAARISEMSGLTATGLPTLASIGRSEWLSA